MYKLYSTNKQRSLRVLECQVEKAGKCYSYAQKAFLGIKLKANKISYINRKQNVRSVIKNKKSRLLALTRL
jgi:hypothetical protein